MVIFTPTDLMCFDPHKSKPSSKHKTISYAVGKEIGIVMNDKCMDVQDIRIKDAKHYANKRLLQQFDQRAFIHGAKQLPIVRKTKSA